MTKPGRKPGPSLAADLTARGVKALKPEESRALALAMRDPDPVVAKDARDKLIEGNLPLAIWAARGFAETRSIRDDSDCFGDACLGLITAVDKYDPARSVTFATYAVRWIRQAIGRGHRLRRYLVHVPLDLDASPKAHTPEFAVFVERAKAPRGGSLDLSRFPARDNPAVRAAGAEEFRRRLAWLPDAVARMPKVIRDATSLYLGLDRGEPRTTAVVADILGKDIRTARNYVYEGIARLRQRAIKEGMQC
jgi:RNA polymerase sigma factor (sigma-70 family)